MSQLPEKVLSGIKSFEAHQNRMAKLQEEFNDNLLTLPEGQRKTILAQKAEVEAEIKNTNAELDEALVIENRYRSAGFRPSEATDLLTLMKDQPIGLIIQTTDKLYVRTPYNTVVEAQAYITSLQEGLLYTSKELTTFTNGSFVDVIKLAFKRLFKRG